MFKYFSAFRKEWLILVRDLAGLILLFLMPMVMVVILALVQEFGWNAISKEPKIHVLFVNESGDPLGNMIEQGLRDTRLFQIVKTLNSIPVDDSLAREEVRSGNYQIGVIIPEGASQKIEQKVNLLVTQIMSGIMVPVGNPFLEMTNTDSVNVIIYFDPAIKGTFKHAFLSSLKEFSLKIESTMIFQIFNEEIKKMFPQYQSDIREYQETVYFSEIYPSGEEEQLIASTTQHNVPAWAIFAMFFIVIPLSSSIIKEREEGSLIRLHTLPVSYMTIFLAKSGVYLIVCLVQFTLMVLAGMFILPLFNMPPLDISHHFFSITIMVLASSLSALGFGIMVGTLARTHQQAAAFGSVAVVIMAALGGLWVPIYFFPEIMLKVASMSPLNWAYTGFIDIFLRNYSTLQIMPDVLKLLIFFAVTISIAGVYRTLKPPISSS